MFARGASGRPRQVRPLTPRSGGCAGPLAWNKDGLSRSFEAKRVPD